MRIIGYFLIAILGGLSCMLPVLAEDKEEILSQKEMRSVTTEEGFRYFAGRYDRSEFPINFITMYTFKNIGDVPKVTIVGNSVEVTYPVSEIGC